MGRISKYEEIVLPILMFDDMARGDDKRLYLSVLQKLGFDTSVSLYRFLTSPGFPNWESITRVRRKLQEQYPDLRPAENVQKSRELAEEDFLGYARS
jgi:hypothetical protein